MGDVIRLPIIPRPIPHEDFVAGDDPHSNALKAITIWEGYALKYCGADWVAKLLEDRLWRIRSRRLMEEK